MIDNYITLNGKRYVDVETLHQVQKERDQYNRELAHYRKLYLDQVAQIFDLNRQVEYSKRALRRTKKRESICPPLSLVFKQIEECGKPGDSTPSRF